MNKWASFMLICFLMDSGSSWAVSDVIYYTKEGRPEDYTPAEKHVIQKTSLGESLAATPSDINAKPITLAERFNPSPSVTTLLPDSSINSDIPTEALELQAGAYRPHYNTIVDYAVYDEGPDRAAPVGGLGTGTFQFDLLGQLRGFSIGAKLLSDTLPEGQMSLFVQQRGPSFCHASRKTSRK